LIFNISNALLGNNQINQTNPHDTS